MKLTGIESHEKNTHTHSSLKEMTFVCAEGCRIFEFLYFDIYIDISIYLG